MSERARCISTDAHGFGLCSVGSFPEAVRTTVAAKWIGHEINSLKLGTAPKPIYANV